jgi:hypothetical protein
MGGRECKKGVYMEKIKRRDLPQSTTCESDQANFLDLPSKTITQLQREASELAYEEGWIKIGQVAVDSGHLLICDPAKKEYDDARIIELNTSKGWSTQYSESSAVVIPSGLGSGIYDVEARVAEVPGFGKRISEIRIGFVGLGTMYPIVESPSGKIGVGFIARHQDRYED